MDRNTERRLSIYALNISAMQNRESGQSDEAARLAAKGEMDVSETYEGGSD